MRTICLCNQKGGATKTTCTVNLGAALAEAGRRVLIIDLDPQHSATTWYRAAKQGRGVYDLFMDGEANVPGLIMETLVGCVSIIPSSPLAYNIERGLAGEPGAEHTLRVKLGRLPEGAYDYILMDCPPSLGLLTVNALVAASEVFVPMEAHVLGLHGLDKLTQTVNVVKERLNPTLAITGIIASRVNARTTHAKEVIADLRGRFPTQFFKTIIRENIRLAECPSQGKPINIYAPTSSGAEDFRGLAAEVIAQEQGVQS
jgi:chromosome partitioning protein